MAKRVVLVEDDALLSEMYQAAMQNEGMECITARDGAAGLKAILDHNPDLVLLDLMLPQMSGDEVLAALRENDQHRDTPVFVMTNISETEAPDSLKLLDFERYIVKANTTLVEVVKIVKQRLSLDNSEVERS